MFAGISHPFIRSPTYRTARGNSISQAISHFLIKGGQRKLRLLMLRHPKIAVGNARMSSYRAQRCASLRRNFVGTNLWCPKLNLRTQVARRNDAFEIVEVPAFVFLYVLF